MYGGRIETNDGNVTDELWVFNIRSQSWSTKTPTVIGHGQQYAVDSVPLGMEQALKAK